MGTWTFTLTDEELDALASAVNHVVDGGHHYEVVGSYEAVETIEGVWRKLMCRREYMIERALQKLLG